MTATTYPHIEVRDGIPYIEGTRMKVAMIVVEHLAHHWDAEAIRRQHPSLTPAQIYSALAFYYDHQSEMDGVIQERMDREETAVAAIDASPLQRRLRELKQDNAGAG